MAVTVEIKTGTRRIISYLMSPLVRYKQEMLRERCFTDDITFMHVFEVVAVVATESPRQRRNVFDRSSRATERLLNFGTSAP
jgi:hypothetical protein